jgi:hypothetical protein
MFKIFLNSVLFLLFFQIANAQTAEKAEFRLDCNKVTVQVGEEFVVNLKVKNFTDIIGIQWSLKWNLSDFEFQKAKLKSVSNAYDSTSTNLIQGNTLLFSWIYDKKPETLSDGATMYELKFKSKKAGTLDGICFAQDAFGIEIWKDSQTQLIVPVQADFIGLGCGFVWTKTAQGTKSIKSLNVLSENNLVLANTKVFPNPFSDVIRIELPSQTADNATFILSDVLGRVVLQKELKNIDIPLMIETSTLKAGQYIYKIMTNNATKSGVIIK